MFRWLHKLRTVFGIGFSLILLWVLLRQTSLEWINLNLSRSGWLYWIGSILVFIFTIYFQSFRVKLIWLPRKGLDTYSGLLSGNFYNCILPGNLGEGIRAMHLSRKNKISLSKSFASQILEKYVDAFTFILLSLLWYSLYGFSMHYIHWVIFITCCMCALVYVSGMVLMNHRNLAKKIISIFPMLFLPKKRIWRFFLDFCCLHNNLFANKVYLLYFAFGCFLLGVNAFQYFLVMKAVDLPLSLVGLKSSYFIALCMVIIAFLPSAPGNTGVAHYGTYSALLLLSDGMVVDNAMLQKLGSFAVFHHLSFFLPEIVIGLVAIIKERKYLF